MKLTKLTDITISRNIKLRTPTSNLVNPIFSQLISPGSQSHWCNSNLCTLFSQSRYVNSSGNLSQQHHKISFNHLNLLAFIYFLSVSIALPSWLNVTYAWYFRSHQCCSHHPQHACLPLRSHHMLYMLV